MRIPKKLLAIVAATLVGVLGHVPPWLVLVEWMLKWDEYIVEVPPKCTVAAQQAHPSIRVIMFSPLVIDSRFW